MSDRRARNRIKDLLGVKPPADATDVRFQRVQPSSDLAMYDAYIRFDTTREGYSDFVAETATTSFVQADPLLLVRLTGRWKLRPGSRVDWWDCTTETPDNAMTGSFGVDGFVLAKHEKGRAYLHVHDNGGTPGP